MTVDGCGLDSGLDNARNSECMLDNPPGGRYRVAAPARCSYLRTVPVAGIEVSRRSREQGNTDPVPLKPPGMRRATMLCPLLPWGTGGHWAVAA